MLLIYGGGSIKKTGVYDAVISALNDTGKTVTELNGVMPNPTLEKHYEGAALAKKSSADFILAVGGGSVCDYAKAVSVSAHCTENPWEKYFINMKPVDNAIIPVGTVLTMVGTGSEMNGGSVITNHKIQRKIGRVFGEDVFPKFSILNPEFTYTVPYYQMTAGFFRYYVAYPRTIFFGRGRQHLRLYNGRIIALAHPQQPDRGKSPEKLRSPQ